MNPLFDKPFTFDRVARILFGLAVISGIIYLIAVLRNALLPFLIAWLLAYMMQPFVKFFQYKVKLKSRLLSILAVLVSTSGDLAGGCRDRPLCHPGVQPDFGTDAGT